MMPFVSRPNPHRSTWSSMQLFLREQVYEFAIKKWGSLEAIKVESQRRADLHQNQKERKFEGNLRELRRKTRLVKRQTDPKNDGKHVHHFEEQQTEDDQVVTICTKCSFKVVSEEI